MGFEEDIAKEPLASVLRFHLTLTEGRRRRVYSWHGINGTHLWRKAVDLFRRAWHHVATPGFQAAEINSHCRS